MAVSVAVALSAAVVVAVVNMPVTKEICSTVTVNYYFRFHLTGFQKLFQFMSSPSKCLQMGTLVTDCYHREITDPLHIQGGVRMTLADQSIRQFIKCLQLFILAMKCLGKVFMSLPQSLDIIDSALLHTATVILVMIYSYFKNLSPRNNSNLQIYHHKTVQYNSNL